LFINSLIFLFIHLSIYSLICLFIHLFVYLFTYLFIYSLICSFIHLFVYLFTYLFIYSLICLFIHSFFHSCSHLFILWLTVSSSDYILCRLVSHSIVISEIRNWKRCGRKCSHSDFWNILAFCLEGPKGHKISFGIAGLWNKIWACDMWAKLECW
jgi:hypothetical protein